MEKLSLRDILETIQSDDNGTKVRIQCPFGQTSKLKTQIDFTTESFDALH